MRFDQDTINLIRENAIENVERKHAGYYVKSSMCVLCDSPHKGTMTRSFYDFCAVNLDDLLNKRSSWRPSETPCSLWHATATYNLLFPDIRVTSVTSEKTPLVTCSWASPTPWPVSIVTPSTTLVAGGLWWVESKNEIVINLLTLALPVLSSPYSGRTMSISCLMMLGLKLIRVDSLVV